MVQIGESVFREWQFVPSFEKHLSSVRVCLRNKEQHNCYRRLLTVYRQAKLFITCDVYLDEKDFYIGVTLRRRYIVKGRPHTFLKSLSQIIDMEHKSQVKSLPVDYD